MKKMTLGLCALLLMGAGCYSPDPSAALPGEDQLLNRLDETPSSEIAEDGTEEGVEVIDGSAALALDAEAGDVVDLSASLALSMESGNFFFKPNTITAKAGQEVTVTMEKNTGLHTFVIDEINLKASIEEGESFTFTAPSDPGSYAYYCDIGNHRAFGMEGTLIVE